MADSESKDAAAVAAALFQGVHKGSTAYRLLSKMGWEEGQGLGANKQGITTHVKVKKKWDAMGVGMAENADRQRDWTTGMVNFDLILSRLKAVASKHGESGAGADNDSGSSSSSEDEKPAVRSSKKSQQPLKKKGKSKAAAAKVAAPKESSTSSSSSSSEDEGTAARKPAAATTKLATHVGRYHKRERGKSVRGYSAGDLAAILGAVQGGAAEPAPVDPADAAWAPVGALEVQASHEEQEDSDDSSSGPAKCGEEHDAAAREPSSSGSPAPRSWWSSLFVKAGQMGSTKHELHSRKVKGTAAVAGAKPGPSPAAAEGIKINGFSEQDQENLYTKAHLGATHGKQGLGRGSAPKKVAGAHWSGTKTKLASDSEEEEEEGVEAGSGDSTSSDEADDTVVVLSSKKEQAAGHVEKEVVVKLKPSQGAELANGGGRTAAATKGKAVGKEKSEGKKRKSVTEPAPLKSTVKRSKVEEPSVEPLKACKEQMGGGEGDGKVMWKKLARGVLKAAPSQRLKVQLLSKRVLKAAGLDSGGCDKKLMKKLKSLPQVFQVCDKFVKLL